VMRISSLDGRTVIALDASKVRRDLRVSLYLVVAGAILAGLGYSYLALVNPNVESMADFIIGSVVVGTGTTMLFVGALFYFINRSLLRRPSLPGPPVTPPR